ncbi:hypothetical protein PYCC9005_005081 [Savitreella phatthalungensis]
MLDFLSRWTAAVCSTGATLSNTPLVFEPEMEDITILVCRCCGAHLSQSAAIMSKAFTGRYGRAVLVRTTSNVSVTGRSERVLSTGSHVVGDIACRGCDTIIGWKYMACPASQVYKQDKFILEEHCIRKLNSSWLE